MSISRSATPFRLLGLPPQPLETPNGQVYLRKTKPVRIQPAELALVEQELQRKRLHL